MPFCISIFHFQGFSFLPSDTDFPSGYASNSSITYAILQVSIINVGPNMTVEEANPIITKVYISAFSFSWNFWCSSSYFSPSPSSTIKLVDPDKEPFMAKFWELLPPWPSESLHIGQLFPTYAPQNFFIPFWYAELEYMSESSLSTEVFWRSPFFSVSVNVLLKQIRTGNVLFLLIISFRIW